MTERLIAKFAGRGAGRRVAWRSWQRTLDEIRCLPEVPC